MDGEEGSEMRKYWFSPGVRHFPNENRCDSSFLKISKNIDAIRNVNSTRVEFLDECFIKNSLCNGQCDEIIGQWIKTNFQGWKNNDESFFYD